MRANQPAGLQVVLDQPAPEVADAQLPDRRRQHDVVLADVDGPHHAGEHDHLAIAVDLDLARAFQHQIAVRQHLDDVAVIIAVSSPVLVVTPPPLNLVSAPADTRLVGSTAEGSFFSTPNNCETDALAALFLFNCASAVPAALMLSITRMVMRSLRCRARGSAPRPTIQSIDAPLADAGARRAESRYFA